MSKAVFPDKSKRRSSDDLNALLGGATLLLPEIENYLEAGNHIPGRDRKF